ncbi:hypothetical protein L873DRAFT_1801056, partial [Choiromyces venosus 120613-1]
MRPPVEVTLLPIPYGGAGCKARIQKNPGMLPLTRPNRKSLLYYGTYIVPQKPAFRRIFNKTSPAVFKN